MQGFNQPDVCAVRLEAIDQRQVNEVGEYLVSILTHSDVTTGFVPLHEMQLAVLLPRVPTPTRRQRKEAGKSNIHEQAGGDTHPR